jgi:Mrp family chromosome partitioning ATPase
MLPAIHLSRVVERNSPRETSDNHVRKEPGSEKECDVDLAKYAVPIQRSVTGAPSDEELQLVQRLFFLPRNENPQTVVFCGVNTNDAAEFVCARTAEVLASQVQQAVCLVDANLREPALHRRYDMDDAIGLNGDRSQSAQKEPGPMATQNLWLLPARAVREYCPGLRAGGMNEQLLRLRKKFGFVLICAPALESAPDGILLGQIFDGVVLVLRERIAYRDATLRARRCLDEYEVRLLGVVMNREPESDSFGKYWKNFRHKILAKKQL